MNASDNVGKPPAGRRQEIGGVPSEETVGIPTLWNTYPFAPEWLEDARREARKPADHNARRREVIFAICFAESYLFEWVLNRVLDWRDFGQLVEDLNRYFPPGSKRGVRDKWKEVPKRLLEDNRVTGIPELEQPYWQDFTRLVEMRDGLIHARSSRPGTTTQPDKERPLPSKTDLDNLPAGWPTKVVIKLVDKLHEATGLER